ncbi:macrophage mannose receptor 1-like [Trachinotus anak]|uniref:macrophage mannose receptor 1-like n=1 Tax=Trachinotus anak TaxID=443729 RepID=UPI0039F2438E
MKQMQGLSHSHRLKERNLEETIMEKVLVSVITASALCAVSLQAARQYHFVYEQKNMTEALSYCREKYRDLATIENMEDVNILEQMVDLNQMVDSEYRAWIGLYDDENSWRWSLSDGSFYTQGETEFRNWASIEPNNNGGREHCGVINNDGTWNDFVCGGAIPAVCADVTGLGKTEYVFINKNMNWTEAQSYCRAHHTDLVSVRNSLENEKVTKLVTSSTRVWIGLYRDSWKWLDGNNSSFRFWKVANNEPNNKYWRERCVSADFNKYGEWEDWNCDLTRAFICHSEPTVSKKLVKVKLMTRSSSLDLNHPTVMEDILKQLKQRLKDKGVNRDIKLSWKKQSDGKIFHKEKETKENIISKRDDL